MRKTHVAGKVAIVVGVLASAGLMIVFLWPLGVGMVAVFVVYLVFRLLLDIKEAIVRKKFQIAAAKRMKPQSTADELADPAISTTVIS